MIGAIIGDIAGSRFEFCNYKRKDFGLLTRGCYFTDDTVMTLAIAEAFLQCGSDRTYLSDAAVRCMQKLGRKYPHSGFGTAFYNWIFSDDPAPYNSFGNGAAMRVSACAYAGNSLKEVCALSRAVTCVTHNHPEGIKGAEAVATCIFLARMGKDKKYIRDFVESRYYPLDFTINQIRPDYEYNVTCQGSVPQAIEAFLESVSFTDSIRTAVSLGGDSDTIAAITGSIAEPYYGVQEEIRAIAETFLDGYLLSTLRQFEKKFNARRDI